MEISDSYTRNKLLKDYAAIIDKSREESKEIEQILGKALGYPWFKDDPKNFPTATEEDGVCVGIETPWSLAMIVADKIKELSKNNPHDGSTLDSFLLEEAELKIKNLEEELVKWKACADMLFVYADEVKCETHSQALYESVCEDIKKYENLKNENRGNQTNP